MQPPAGDQFDDVQDHLAFPEGVKGGGDGPQVVGEGAHEHEVVAQPEEFAQQHPDHLGPLRYGNAGQLFHGHHIGQIVGRPGQVIDPIGVGMN